MKTDLRAFFYDLSDGILNKRLTGEEMRLSFNAEESDFVRFNKASIRQPGAVNQQYLGLELIRGKRHCSAQVSISQDKELDDARIDFAIKDLRRQMESLPEDPHFVIPNQPQSKEQVGEDRLPPTEQVMDQVLNACRGTDFVGILASGGIFFGFSSSFGQKSWFSSHPYHLDFSIYAGSDKAVKESYAGLDWNEEIMRQKILGSQDKLKILQKPVKQLSPGKYRVFIAPAALEEVFGLLSWDSFGIRSQKSKTTPLLSLVEGETSLSPGVTLIENTAEGVAPCFDDSGFIKPDSVTLIKEGKLVGSMVSPRSSIEYSTPTNAASAYESPTSLDLLPGDIPSSEVLERIGDGIYIGNLWYLNYSDRRACRMTGMTRFGTFWVQNGQITCPTQAMRFDESLYRMFGENLEGLTKERDLILDPSSYHSRSTRSMRLPGALVKDFTLTL